MGANDYQVGGDHYNSTYKHWDLALKIPLPYLEACATKHVTRWRKKDGIKDLQKAAHYLAKMIEVGDYDVKRRPGVAVDVEVHKFAEANDLTFIEYQFLYLMCTYRDEKTLRNANRILTLIMDEARGTTRRIDELNRPGTPEDGGQHANQ